MTVSRRRPPRCAVRGILMREGRLLLVNAYKGREGFLYCAPGGGVEAGQSLHDNLRREFQEETGLTVAVGAPCLVNEFHDPDIGFHQIDLYFHVTWVAGDCLGPWRDPEGIVTERRWVTQDEMAQIRVKPDLLAQVAFGGGDGAVIAYDPLELILR